MGGWVANSDLYNAYVGFCNEEDLPIKHKNVVFRELSDAVEDVLGDDAKVKPSRRSPIGSDRRTRGKAGVTLSGRGRTLLAEYERDQQERLD